MCFLMMNPFLCDFLKMEWFNLVNNCLHVYGIHKAATGFCVDHRISILAINLTVNVHFIRVLYLCMYISVMLSSEDHLKFMALKFFTLLKTIYCQNYLTAV